MKRGTCLITYLPMRLEPSSGAEMVNSLIFGESYDVLQVEEKWLKIKTDFDAYEGWINRAAWSGEQTFPEINDALFLDCISNHRHLFIPCGANIPESMQVDVHGLTYQIARKLKTSHHLPLRMRILKTAQSFLNTPYLWGGRTFMGVDCSGLTQVVFKACGIQLPRDTSQQINSGISVPYSQKEACDLAFFSSDGSQKVSHVGIVMESGEVIHAGAYVRINELTEQGLWVDSELKYTLLDIRRIL